VSPAAGSTAEARAAELAALPSPGAWRRLACFLYEGVLLFGVVVGLVVLPAVLLAYLTRQQLGLISPALLGGWLFSVVGAYFVYFWSRGGQTLAMLTWHIRLVMVNGKPVSRPRALCRYVLSWIWFLPALLSVHLSGLKGGAPVFGALLAGVLAYAALSRLHPDRQYWHDALCGTRLITWHPQRPSP
jgi:uncharacterized RDD family membrane protein YckC